MVIGLFLVHASLDIYEFSWCVVFKSKRVWFPLYFSLFLSHFLFISFSVCIKVNLMEIFNYKKLLEKELFPFYSLPNQVVKLVKPRLSYLTNTHILPLPNLLYAVYISFTNRFLAAKRDEKVV